MVELGMITDLTAEDLASEIQCEVCICAKMTHRPFPKQAQHRATAVLDLVHSNVCGPMEVPSLGGNRYFVTFVDDFSRFATVYCIAQKSNVEAVFWRFKAAAETKHGCRI